MQEIYHDGHAGPEIPVDDEHLIEQIKKSLAKGHVREVRIRKPKDYSGATHEREKARRRHQMECNSCSGTGRLICEGCGGESKGGCARCHGVGTIMCPDCGGGGVNSSIMNALANTVPKDASSR